jgi:hypothetical protein
VFFFVTATCWYVVKVVQVVTVYGRLCIGKLHELVCVGLGYLVELTLIDRYITGQVVYLE